MHDVATRPIAIEADLLLCDGVDPRAAGAAVTTALCGHWEHEGRCRWPHNTRIDASVSPAIMRTVAIVDDATLDEVIALAEHGLRNNTGWQVTTIRVREITDEERGLADRLDATSA